MRRLAAALALLAGPAAAQGFDGVYRQGIGADCARVGADGGALEVRGDVLFGAESRCEMRDAEPLGGLGAVLYRMECRAEGTRWTAPAILMEAANGGLILVWKGYAFAYDRCPEPVSALARRRPEPRPGSRPESRPEAPPEQPGLLRETAREPRLPGPAAPGPGAEPQAAPPIGPASPPAPPQ